MTQILNAQVTIKDWQEDTIREEAGAYMVKHAKVSYSYEADLVGESTADYLLMYHPDETASFVAVEHIKARLGDRPGTLVLRHSGCHENDAATARCEVVQGTGAFEGVSGTASYSATDRTYQLRLELDQNQAAI